jgi:serine/threonine protein kinase
MKLDDMSMCATLDDTPAGRYGSYEAIRVIGRGGMGTVYLCRHIVLGRLAAVKVLNRRLEHDALAIERFFREAHALAQVRHPHVVGILDVGVEGDHPFMVMELASGETLVSLLEREPRMPLGPLLALAIPVASAVAAIHDGGIVHRDLKPANIIVTHAGSFRPHPTVLDFGISRTVKERQTNPGITRSDVILGTVPYLSPEQIQNARLASPLSDQYALGVMLYQCLAGEAPFKGASTYETLHAVLNAPVPPLASVRDDLPIGLEDVILRAMSRDPASRFPDVRSLARGLLAFGDSHLWRSWSADLLVAPVAPGEQGASSHTLPELRAADAWPAPVKRPGPRRSRWWRSVRALVLPFVAGAAAATVLLALRGTPDAVPAGAAPTPILSESAESAIDRRPGPDTAASTPETNELSDARAGWGAPSIPETRSRRVRPRPSPPATASPQPSLGGVAAPPVGKNRAFILE